MLEMRPDCEKCGRDLGPESREAWICSFECTFCSQCDLPQCPNCGGILTLRPTRSTELLERFPASSERKFKPT